MVFLSVIAACSVSNIVKSSLGPVGLDKMIVDDVGVSNFELKDFPINFQLNFAILLIKRFKNVILFYFHRRMYNSQSCYIIKNIM